MLKLTEYEREATAMPVNPSPEVKFGGFHLRERPDPLEAFNVTTRGTKPWEEDLHPRADAGRFGGKPKPSKPGKPDKKPKPSAQASKPQPKPALGEGGKRSVLDKLKKEGGFTYKPSADRFKHLGSGGFAVSPYKSRERVFSGGKLTVKDVRAYIQGNKDLLAKGNHYIGGWRDSKTGKVYLDVSIISKDEKDAHQIAKANGQKAIFDMKNGNTIDADISDKKPGWSGRQTDRELPLTRRQLAGSKEVTSDQFASVIMSKAQVKTQSEQSRKKLYDAVKEAGKVYSGPSMMYIGRNIQDLQVLDDKELQKAWDERTGGFPIKSIAFYGNKQLMIGSKNLEPNVLIHEMGHALDRSLIDPRKHRYSDSDEWGDAWTADMVGSSNEDTFRDYGKSNPHEGFACALEAAHDTKLNTLAEKAPNVTRYLVKNKLINAPEGFKVPAKTKPTVSQPATDSVESGQKVYELIAREVAEC